MPAGRLLTIRGPWAGRYPAAAGMVVLLLVPYLALAAAMRPMSPYIRSDLHSNAVRKVARENR